MLNHLIVKQWGSLHAIQIRPISLKTSIRRPFINRFISIASHQKSPLNYDAVEVLWEISVNGRHLNYFSRGLRINPHWHLQLSSGELYHDEKFASPYIVERIHKIHLKCLVLIANPCGSNALWNQTPLWACRLLCWVHIKTSSIFICLPSEFSILRLVFLVWSDPLKFFAKFFRVNTTDLDEKKSQLL